MLKPAFIDLSHHNTVPQSFEETAAAGIVGVIHKMTEGTSYVDDKAAARAYLAHEVGLLWGLYHFVRPGSMIDQVNHFLAASAPLADQNTLFALDWEDAGVSLADAITFLQHVEMITGRSPVIYSGHVLKEALGGEPDERISAYRLWLAQYASAPTLPPGFSKFWGWQYTDQGSVPGVTPPTDLNAFDGFSDELRASWSGAVIEPPKPVPPEELVVQVFAPPGVRVEVWTKGHDRRR